MSVSRLFSCASVLLLSVPSPLLQASEPDIERIVTTATRVDTVERNLPLVVSDVSESRLTLNAHTHIQESLAQIAGINIHRGNGQEYLPALRSPVFTGAGACGELLTTEDGIPLRAAGFCNINELFEAHSEVARRIEVLKGPGSVFYGANAIHGVINVITPDTTRGDGFARAELGSFGYQRYALQAGQDWGDSGIGMATSVTRDSGYRDDESVAQEKVSVRYRLQGNNWESMTGLAYTNLDQDTAGFITGFEAYKDADIAQSNANPEAFRKNRAWRLWSRNTFALSDGSQVIVTPYLRDQSMDFLQHFLPGQPLEENAQRSAGLQTVWHSVSGKPVRFSVGLDAEYAKGELIQSQPRPTQGSPFLVETVPQGLHYDYEVKATQVAPFINLQWQKSDWLVNIGARYERMAYDYTNNMVSGRTREDGSECGFGGCRYNRPESGKNQFNNLSPSVGVTYTVNENLTLFSNIARGYRAPQATELYRLQRGQQITDLEAVDALSREIGLKGHYKQASFVAALYIMDKDNVIFRDSDFFNVSDGKTQHKGLEVEAQWRFAEQWQAAIAYTHGQHTYEYDRVINSVNINGNDIDTAPRNLANIRLSYFPAASAQVALEWHSVSAYFTDPENVNEYQGHDLLNLRALWRLSSHIQVSARVINLTNEAYAERADFTGFSGDRYFPGKPRTFFIGFAYDW
ncbi:TonB-dependent receptor [Alteromonas sediminis]|uniref:TonB-dependent receptor n=1 Tax=Alteromonas sediminis TaxID=2259342 RepID=A0A3N5Y5W4_9ALTE|nr:TonB-dependent receptor [Alteromonas sediminis]RPJ68596.1 TonB-dependent receptor [Alteromonas sediminis]